MMTRAHQSASGQGPVRVLVLALCALVLRADVSFASPGQSATAAVRGVVRDQTNAVIPNARIGLTSLETGRILHSESSADGSFQFVALPPGRYRLAFSFQGFAPAEHDVDLLVDQHLALPITLALARQTQSIDVVAPASPVVEPARTSLGRTVTSREIESLPILVPRSFAALATLAPGVLPATVNIGGQGVAAAGQGPNSNTTLVDGLSADGITGSGVALDAIREFRIVSNHFSAEFGQASGAVVNVVTRSGGNTPHGRVYYFQQHSGLNATSAPAQLVGAEDPEDRQASIGGFWGGPLIRNRLFTFASVDQLIRNTTYINTSPVTMLFRPNDSVAIPVEWDVPKLFLRSDVNLTPANVLTLRFAYERATIHNAAREAESAAERGRHLHNPKHNVALLDAHAIGSTGVNELRLQWVHERFRRNVNGLCEGCAALNYQSILLGKPPNDPQLGLTDRVQLADALTWLFSGAAGQHALKLGFGAEVVQLRSNTPMNSVGTFTFPHDLPFDAGNRATYPNRFTQNIGDPRNRVRETIVSLFGQDEWRLGDRLSLNLGVRWDNTHWPGPGGRRNDVAPRLGVSIDPWKHGSSVVRAGLGRYYDESQLTVARNAEVGFVMLTIRNPGYQGDLRQFDPYGLNPNRGGAPAVPQYSVNRYAATRTPYSDQASIGWQQQVTGDIGVSVDLVRALGYRLPVGRDLNYPDLTIGGRPDPTLNQIIVVETLGHSWYTGLQVGVQKRPALGHAFAVSYTWSSSENDTDGPASFPQDQTNLLGDRGPASHDSRHRVTATGMIDLPFGCHLSAVVTARTALPYNVTTGFDDNGDSVINDRPPGEARNAARGAAMFQADMRVTKTVRVRGRRLALLVEAFNVTNRANWTDYNGRMAATAFGRPAGATAPRQIQLGARLDF
jgi:hypothetical protein